MMLRRALIEYPCNQGQHEAWLLRDSDDLVAYFTMVGDRAGKFIEKLLKSGVHPNRWDHMLTKSPEGLVMATTLTDCKISGGRPLLKYDEHMSRLQWSMTEQVLIQGKILAVNSAGGYHDVSPDVIIREWFVEPEREKTYHIASDCKFINLENDDKIERQTREFMQSHGYRDSTEFSFICELRQYNATELTKIFTQFIQSGGECVYVYTTGMDVNQMYEYCHCAIDAGLTQFIFHFNSGMTDEISEFIKWLKSQSVDVDVRY